MSGDWNVDVANRRRFRFGVNWQRFALSITDAQIETARVGLINILGVETLTNQTFLDAGCGSGLMGLAARDLGAAVHSFDFDPDAVATTEALRDLRRPNDAAWTISSGSVLDRAYLSGLGSFDIVYSWGVLHHTGAMWAALQNIMPLVRPDGLLALALYNDQGRPSRVALKMKRRYVRAGEVRRFVILSFHAWLQGIRWLLADVRDRRNPIARYGVQSRGMATWTDLIDWVGGYPFEVARPDEVLRAVRPHGFELEWLRTVGGGHGNNEYRFRRVR
jgi:2-polyprenyl-3-methyl-5-hydroxy-6-metoxy-1,4-benzoquinol methylase